MTTPTATPPAPPTDGEAYRLSCGEFTLSVYGMTFRRNIWLTGHSLAAGLGELGRVATPHDADAIAARLYSSGRASLILAGLLVPAGQRWDQAQAEQLATTFDELTDPDDHRVLAAALSRGLMLFLRASLPSEESTRNSSTPAPDAAAGAGGESEATSTSAPTGDQ